MCRLSLFVCVSLFVVSCMLSVCLWLYREFVCDGVFVCSFVCVPGVLV